MQPITFETERLRVALMQATPNEFFNEVDVFVAFLKEDGVGYPVCVCTIDPAEGCCSYHWVEWIETNERHRRQGLARELLRGIVEHYEAFCEAFDLQMSGGSDAGDAFVANCYADTEETDGIV